MQKFGVAISAAIVALGFMKYFTGDYQWLKQK